MRRLLMLVSVVALGIAAVCIGGQTLQAAQEATPVGKAVTMSEGITSAQTSLGEIASLPPGPVTVDLYRVRVAPGASLSVATSDPGLGINQVESGVLTLHGFTDKVTVTRASSAGTPGAKEIVAAGAEATLEPGDAFLWLPNVSGEIRNDGAEPAEYVAVTIYPVSAP